MSAQPVNPNLPPDHVTVFIDGQELAAPKGSARLIQRILDNATDAWGIKVTNVEIKHVDLDESMIRAMAKQAEAERKSAEAELLVAEMSKRVKTAEDESKVFKEDAQRRERQFRRFCHARAQQPQHLASNREQEHRRDIAGPVEIFAQCRRASQAIAAQGH